MKSYNSKCWPRWSVLILFTLSGLLIGCRASRSTTQLPTLAATAVAIQPQIDSPEEAKVVVNEEGETAVPPDPTVTTTPDHSPTPGPSPTPTKRPTKTPRPTITPTSLPQQAPRLDNTSPVIREGLPTPATRVPTAVPTFTVPRGTTNILLLGSDDPLREGGVQRTDTMIIVSINRDTQTASMISLPRDLYVYLPGGSMQRLNTAITLGGVHLLKQTILYNFGVPIHFFARVDFSGFQQIVDSIGGVEIAVSCRFEDWRIKSPELDVEEVENWELVALEPGIYQMDGPTALWYARSRIRSDDFDRGRRQQQLLRALFDQGVDLDLVSQVPQLWNTFQDSIETDIDIGRMLQLATLAGPVRENGVQNLYLAGKMQPWTVPGVGYNVQLPIWEGENKMQETFQRLFLPPALNKATRAPIFVEIVNASGNPDMAQLAAENLAWYGFVPIISEASTQEQDESEMSYYAPNFKGSYDWLIHWVMGMRKSEIELVEDDLFEYDYQAVLGKDYDPCLNPFFAPQLFLP